MAIGLTAALVAAWAAFVPVAAQQRTAAGEIRVLPVRGNVWLLSGAGGNVTASVGKDGVMLVDSGSAAMAEKLLQAVRALSQQVTASRRPMYSCVGVVRGCPWWSSSEMLPTMAGPPAPRPLIGIVNTSIDPDHIGGNAVLAEAGRQFGVRNLFSGAVPSAWILAHENVSLPLGRAGTPAAALPSETYFGREKKLNFINGEGVVVTHHPAAHTDGDSMVYFRGSDVLAAGDILNMASYPVIDVEKGGTIQGVVDALNWILDLAVVEHMMEGGTVIVPGHGRLTDAADVAYYRDMATIMRDRVRTLRDRGMTLAEIKAARPSRDYDGRFGRNPAWTPDQFIEAIYRTLPGTHRGTR